MVALTIVKVSLMKVSTLKKSCLHFTLLKELLFFVLNI